MAGETKDPLAVLPKSDAQKHVRARVGREQLDKIIDAMMAAALGCYLFQARNYDGTWIDVEDLDQMREIRDNPAMVLDQHYRFVSLEKPDVRAATLLLAYALDRPAEQKQEIDLTIRGDADLVARLREAYKREPKRPESKSMGQVGEAPAKIGTPSSVH